MKPSIPAVNYAMRNLALLYYKLTFSTWRVIELEEITDIAAIAEAARDRYSRTSSHADNWEYLLRLVREGVISDSDIKNNPYMFSVRWMLQYKDGLFLSHFARKWSESSRGMSHSVGHFFEKYNKDTSVAWDYIDLFHKIPRAVMKLETGITFDLRFSYSTKKYMIIRHEDVVISVLFPSIRTFAFKNKRLVINGVDNGFDIILSESELPRFNKLIELLVAQAASNTSDTVAWREINQLDSTTTNNNTSSVTPWLAGGAIGLVAGHAIGGMDEDC